MTFPVDKPDLDANVGTSTTPLSTGHVSHHQELADNVKGLMDKVGVDSSAVNTTHDFKLSGVADGDYASSLGGTETLTNKTLTAPVLNGSITGTGILDEDNMASDSATALATQQSIKAYVDAQTTQVVNDATPQLGGQLDVNGNSIGDGTLELLSFSETASAVNELTVKNAATGNAPELQATGDDTNIDLELIPKGTGVLSVAGTTDYESNVSADDDIPNVKYVNDNYSNTRSLGYQNTTVANTTTETAIWTDTVAGGYIGTDGKIKADLYIHDFDWESNAVCTIRFKYASSVLASMTVGGSGANFDFGATGTNQDIFIEFEGSNISSQSSQGAYVKGIGASGSSPALYTNSGSGSVDTSSSFTLSITAQWSAASANNSIGARCNPTVIPS